MNKKMLLTLFPACMMMVVSVKAQVNDSLAASRQLNMLFRLNGYWKAEDATIQTNGVTSRFVFTADFKPVSDGTALLMEEHATVPGVGKLSGMNLIGVSPYDARIHWFSADNLGTSHEHVGRFTDENHFSMIYHGMQNRKDFEETVQIEFKGPDMIHINETAKLDGNVQLMVEGSFRRRK